MRRRLRGDARAMLRCRQRQRKIYYADTRGGAVKWQQCGSR